MRKVVVVIGLLWLAASSVIARAQEQQYVVQRGDNLARIARRFGLSNGQAIITRNGLASPDVIRPGLTLIIPVAAPSADAAAATPSPTSAPAVSARPPSAVVPRQNLENPPLPATPPQRTTIVPAAQTPPVPSRPSLPPAECSFVDPWPAPVETSRGPGAAQCRPDLPLTCSSKSGWSVCFCLELERGDAATGFFIQSPNPRAPVTFFRTYAPTVFSESSAFRVWNVELDGDDEQEIVASVYLSSAQNVDTELWETYVLDPGSSSAPPTQAVRFRSENFGASFLTTSARDRCDLMTSDWIMAEAGGGRAGRTFVSRRVRYDAGRLSAYGKVWARRESDAFQAARRANAGRPVTFHGADSAELPSDPVAGRAPSTTDAVLSEVRAATDVHFLLTRSRRSLDWPDHPETEAEVRFASRQTGLALPAGYWPSSLTFPVQVGLTTQAARPNVEDGKPRNIVWFDEGRSP